LCYRSREFLLGRQVESILERYRVTQEADFLKKQVGEFTTIEHGSEVLDANLQHSL
jgi:hypothetical protein